MSYDIRIQGRLKKPVYLEKHDIAGPTRAFGGTTEAWLNVTYNYSGTFQKLFGKDGIRSIYGLSVKKSIKVLDEAIKKLGDVKPNLHNLFDPCEGNVKKALIDLKTLAEMAIEQHPNTRMVWSGD